MSSLFIIQLYHTHSDSAPIFATFWGPKILKHDFDPLPPQKIAI
jgi:hypothetical protein